jgi:hypothetical protein
VSPRTVRRFLGVVVLVAAVAVIGYVGLEGILILRGVLEPGPVRLLTLALNLATAAALLYLGRLTLRAPRK